MQAYDLIMIIVLATAAILGAIKGFAWQMASLASVFASYLVAVNFRYDLAKMIQATPPWNLFLAMLILYVGTSFVIWVGFRLLSGVIDSFRLKEFDRHLGAAFGLGKGMLYCLLITMFAMTLLGPKQQAAICQSRSGFYIASALDNAGGLLPKELHDVVGPYLDQLDRKLHQGGLYGDGLNGGGLNGGGLNGGGLNGGGLAGGQGGGSGWNLWPNAPASPAEAAAPFLNSAPFGNSAQPNFAPTNLPTMLPGSQFGSPLPTAPQSGPQSAQQPNLNWPR